MPALVIANPIVFQPWDWDNTKVLIYWSLAGCVMVATLLARTSRQHRDLMVRSMVAAAVAVLVLSGPPWNLFEPQGTGRTRLLTAEEVQLGEAVRDQTAPDALFAIGTQHSHPVPMLAGRRVLTSFPFFLWTWGIDWAWGIDKTQREHDLRAIYAMAPDAPRRLRDYGVDDVVTGPAERKDFKADLDVYRERYPTVIHTANYEVFAFGEGPGGSIAEAEGD